MISKIFSEATEKGIYLYLKEGRLAYKVVGGDLPEDFKKTIIENKSAIIEFLEFQSKSAVADEYKIKSFDRTLIPLLLSYPQQRLWLLDQIDGGSAHYNMPAALKLTGALDREALQKAFTTILERHESLRTCFVANDNGEPLQVIQALTPFNIPLIDVSHLEEGERQLQLAERVAEEFGRVFDLSADVMLRAQLIKIANNEHIILVNMHHIASDGWSMSILINEFSTLYTAYIQGQSNPLPALPIQYADYAHWQRNWLQGEVLDEQMGYWTKQLAGLPVVHSLPLDHPRPTLQSFVGNVYGSQIDAHTSNTLMTLCQSQGATLFMGLHAAFSVLLSRYSNETDIVVGSPIANREQADIAGLIGFFVNTLVLRSDLSENPSFIQLLNHSKTMLLDAYAHQQVPFEQIVERLQPERSLSHSALFQILLVLQNNEQGVLELPGLTLSQVENSRDAGIAKYDITLSMTESEEGLYLGWEYNSDLFEQDTIARMANHFALLINALIAQPNENVFKVEMLTQPERHQLLIDWNNTKADYPGDKCVHELFEAQVNNNPNAIAVVFENEKLTYNELNQRANQLAHYLITEKHVKPDTLVGICVERSLEMVIGILAILKAGGAYVPLDPTLPELRLADILEGVGEGILLTQSSFINRISSLACEAIALDDSVLINALSVYPTTNPDIAALLPHHLAYVLYTSGSTGKPKAIAMPHGPLVNLIAAIPAQAPVLSGAHTIVQFASIGFDMSFTDMFLTFNGGGRLVLIDSDTQTNVQAFVDVVQKNHVSALNLPYSMLQAMSEYCVYSSITLPNLKGIISTAEQLKITPAIRAFFSAHPDIELINHYGPSETHVVTAMTLSGDSNTWLEFPDIGKPINNVTCYVLNDKLQPVPHGIDGHLYLGGDCLARGYLGRADLTAEKFIANPFYDKNNLDKNNSEKGLNKNHSERLYQTGDLVRWTKTGELEYRGRIDHQVKIRGFRIELGEIESVLRKHSDVNDVVVLAKESTTGDKRLVAYIVNDHFAQDVSEQESQESQELQNEFINHLRTHVTQSLPDYMVPSAFVLLASFPLTPNGKVDRKALPEPDLSSQQNTYVAPRNETEKALCDIWQDVLGVERVGVNDNFFSLGGHSLSATRLVSRINKLFDVTLPLKTLFSTQTLEALAQTLATLDTHHSIPALMPVSRDQDLPVSYAQQRLWLLDQIDGGSAHYNMPAALKLTGALDREALQKAFTTILERHESLRTCFVANDNGEPLQVIQALTPFNIPLIDVSHLEEGERQLQLAERVAEEFGRVFDLSADVMLRAQLIKIANNEHIILVNMHHIASDGWSMSILINEFSTLYTAYIQGQSNPLPALPIQYADYAHWQRNWLQGEVLDEQMGYWTKQLAGLPVVHSLPLDHPRPTLQSFVGNVYGSQIDAHTSNTLMTLCQSQGATLFMGLHAAFSVLLSRYSNETDIVVGSPIANREQADIAGLIGFFVNTLVLRSDLSENPSFIQLLNHSKTMLLDAYAHQQVPFEQIVERLQPERSLSHSALFQILLVLQNNEQGVLELPGLTLSPVEQAVAAVAKYDITLSITESEEGLYLGWEYNSDLFEQDTIARMANHFALLINALIAQPNKNVFKVEMLTQPERHQLLIDWNNTQADYPNDKCVHELFEAQAEANPNSVAVVFENEQLTYQQLNEKANQLAHYLITEKQIKPDTLVGICVERSLEMVIGILAILKAGGAYVPLDPEYPEARLKYMLEDAKLSTVLTQSHLRETTPVSDEQAVYLDSDLFKQQLQTYPAANPDKNSCGLHSNHLAYVIYTSGSTGNPKGVMVEHYNVTRLFDSAKENFDFTEQDVWTMFHSYAFDFSVWEIWGALAQGGKLVVVPYWISRSPKDFYQLLSTEKVTVLNQTPSAFNTLMHEDAVQHISLALRYVVFGGEALNLASLMPWFNRHGDDQPQLINMYGITETTVHVTYRRITQDVAANAIGASLIGNPLSDLQLVVLNQQQVLVPVGVGGEMYVGGAGVTRGYLNQSALTESRFVMLPGFGDERFYRTGDLARYLPNGELDYLGRIDHQVKIRGFRIELGEIENTLSAYPAVKDVIVLAKESTSGDKRLVAYVATDVINTEDESESSIVARHSLVEDLRHHVNQTLPDYMVPSAFVLLEKLPLTANGKVDRKALPEPDMSAQQSTYIAPRTETEKVLCDIWQKVLGVERVGITDNFFQLGGHSLLAMQLIARVNQHFNIDVALKEVFLLQTVAEITQVVESQLELNAGLSLNSNNDNLAVEVDVWEI